MGFLSFLGSVVKVVTAPVWYPIKKIAEVIDDWASTPPSSGTSAPKTGTVENSIKISEELNKIQNDMAEKAKVLEDLIVNATMQEIQTMFKEISTKEDNQFHLDFVELKKQSDQITDSVRGYVKQYYMEKLILDNPDLRKCLEIRDKDERDNQIKEFCSNLKRQAILNLKARLQRAIDKQIGLINGKIQTAIQDIAQTYKKEKMVYDSLLGEKAGEEKNKQKTQMRQIYVHGICEILGTQLEEAQSLLKT